MHAILLDAAGHRRQPVTLPGYHAGRPPRNKGRRYPADPPTVEEIIAVMRTAGAGADGMRLRALIVALAGLWPTTESPAELPYHPHIQHADLGIIYLRGIDNTQIIHAVHERPAPMIPAGPTLPGRARILSRPPAGGAWDRQPAPQASSPVVHHRANGHDRPRPMGRCLDRDGSRVANTLARCGPRKARNDCRTTAVASGYPRVGRERLPRNPPCRATNGHW